VETGSLGGAFGILSAGSVLAFMDRKTNYGFGSILIAIGLLVALRFASPSLSGHIGGLVIGVLMGIFSVGWLQCTRTTIFSSLLMLCVIIFGNIQFYSNSSISTMLLQTCNFLDPM
jgi:hypothetical protein